MKYVLVQTSYSPQKQMVVETYLKEDPMFVRATTLLSDAQIFNTLDEAEKFLDNEQITGHKIVPITKKTLFTAKLKGH